MISEDPPVTVVELVRDAARRTPGAIAVRCEARALTYAELDRQVEALARALRDAGAGSDAPVAILADRSIEMVVAVLAVHRAGAASMPLDAGHPPDRLAAVLEIADCGHLLVARPLTGLLGAIRRLMVTLVIEAVIEDAIQQAPPPPPAPLPAPALEELAYVVFTSGSTGAPKGIAMPHRALAALIRWQLAHHHAARDAPTLLYAAFIFDVFYQELYGTLAAGGCLVVVPEPVRADFARLCELILARDVRRAYLPTVALRYLAAAVAEGAALPRCLEEVLVAGEQLQITDAIRALFTALPGAVLVNQYGPAETHVVTSATLRAPAAGWPAFPAIGRPLPHCPAHLLDDDLGPVPDGATGELYFGGPCVARGYLHRPALTAARFLPAPSAGDRLYRTGDLARRAPDGALEFLGRRDAQVKIRGFRVELGEIEIALVRHPDVRDAAVAVHPAPDGEPLLVAYVVPAGARPLDAGALQGFLADSLPPYMVPGLIEPIAALPQTATGKLDRRALPPPGHGARP